MSFDKFISLNNDNLKVNNWLVASVSDKQRMY